MKLLDNKYKSSTLFSKTISINALLKTLRSTDPKVKEKINSYFEKADNQLSEYFKILTNDKKNIKKRVENLQGALIFMIWLRVKINKEGEKLLFSTPKQKELTLNIIDDIKSFILIRISYLKKTEGINNYVSQHNLNSFISRNKLSLKENCYTFEKSDPLHRSLEHNQILKTAYENYLEENHNVFNVKEFLFYIDGLPEAEKYDSPFWKSKQVFYPSNNVSHYKFATRYDPNKKILLAPLGWPKNGVMSTAGYESKNSCHMVAFVIDLTGQLFVAPHIEGQLHHSTFKSGEDVICAGLISIKDGKVTDITNSSGHYKPSLNNMIYAVNLFNQMELFKEDAKINYFDAKSSPLGKSEILSVKDWLNQKIEIMDKLVV